jgi:hypothetical protein
MWRMCGLFLFLTTIAGGFERSSAWDEQMGHVRNYLVGDLEKLERTGFSVERTICWVFPFYTPIARRLQNSCRLHLVWKRFARLPQRCLMEKCYFKGLAIPHQRGRTLVSLLARRRMNLFCFCSCLVLHG